MFNTDTAEEEYIGNAVGRLMEMMEHWMGDLETNEFKEEIEKVMFYEIRNAYIMGRVMKGSEIHRTITEALEEVN